jgi:hypothetical protein
MSKARGIALLAAGALIALPTVAQANHNSHAPADHGSKSKRCAPKNKGFVVTGNLVSGTADDPATTDVNEASVTITVKNANRHARNSGELTDQNAEKKGVQVKGGTYTLDNDDDAYKVVFSGYEEGETKPNAGDKVRISGKIPVTRKRCAPEGTSTADRYGEPNIRRVKFVDVDEQS